MLSALFPRPPLAPAVLALAVGLAVGCGGPATESLETRTTTDSDMTQLQINDTVEGTGTEATTGRMVRVHYTGWLYDTAVPGNKGRKFDSSLDRNEPFEFPLGAGQVIRGWDDGVAGMKVGGTRILTIPPAMGYGSRGAGGVIPPNATLLFEVQLLDVK
jgi:FKBP-type peptidyl-prolyl cis-trans isomerase FkpA